MRERNRLAVLLFGLSILGLLTAMGMWGLESNKSIQRDSQRIQDLRKLQQVLGLYQINNDRFPVAATAIDIYTNVAFQKALATIQPGYEAPRDPLDPTYRYTYATGATGNTYTLRFCVETNSLPQFTKGCNNVLTP